MEPEDKEKLDRMLSLAEENNVMLRKIRSAQKTSAMFKTIYWIIIIGVTVGAYYYVKPLYDTVTGIFAQGNANLKDAGLSFPGQQFFNKATDATAK